MLETLDILPPDPILGIGQQYVKDTDPRKVGLAVGVYQTEDAITPVLQSVKQAEQSMLAGQNSKVYIAQEGDAGFLDGMNRLIFGDDLLGRLDGRVASLMVPGGCGGLRIAAEVIQQARPGATVWMSKPTWGNHFPLLSSAGVKLKEYRYYDTATGEVNFEAMCEDIADIPQNDVVLLHACCHNPTGADLDADQLDQLYSLMAERELIPFIDAAYLGFSKSLESDAQAIRLAAEKFSEVIVVTSCSKNFGLYRERTGLLSFIGASENNATAAKTQAMAKARQSYSMSPFHGGGIVGTILGDSNLTGTWEAEVSEMRERMNRLRADFARLMSEKQQERDFDFIARNRGMFSNLNISKEQVLRLREEFRVYMLDSSRINVAGLSNANLDYTTDAIARVLNEA